MIPGMVFCRITSKPHPISSDEECVYCRSQRESLERRERIAGLIVELRADADRSDSPNLGKIVDILELLHGVSA